MSGILEQILERQEKILALLQNLESQPKDSTSSAEPPKAPAKKAKKKTRKAKPALTLQDMKEKAKAVLNAAGRDTALSILKDFECDKIGDLEEDQFESFAAACDEAIEEAAEESDDEDDLDL